MEDSEDGSDGHEPGEIAAQSAIKGAVVNLQKMRERGDGVLSQVNAEAGMSVLQRGMTAVKLDEDYRQELKTAFFLSTDESDRVVAAINESDRYGCLRKPIVDWVIARSAGTNGARLRAIFDTISHTTFTTNYAGQKKWWQSDKSRSNKNSPLS